MSSTALLESYSQSSSVVWEWFCVVYVRRPIWVDGLHYVTVSMCEYYVHCPQKSNKTTTDISYWYSWYDVVKFQFESFWTKYIFSL